MVKHILTLLHYFPLCTKGRPNYLRLCISTTLYCLLLFSRGRTCFVSLYQNISRLLTSFAPELTLGPPDPSYLSTLLPVFSVSCLRNGKTGRGDRRVKLVSPTRTYYQDTKMIGTIKEIAVLGYSLRRR